MSDKENNAQKTDKVVTKYDLKRQKRAEEKKKEAKSLMIWKLVGVLIVAVFLGFILSFPVRHIIAVNQTMVTVDGEKIGRVEFDFVYNTVKSNYYANYGSYLQYYGLTDTSDPSTVMYDDKRTFKDYFEEQAVDQIKQNIALQREANAAGFTYDASEDWSDFLKIAEEGAKQSELNLSNYFKASYGDYATKSNLKGLVEKTATLSKYYESVYESKLPTDEEVEKYYSENSADYDSVDYFLTTIAAELPTEPTELADEGAEVAEDGSYTPSEAEKEAAMEETRPEAEAALEKVMTEGEAHTSELQSAVTYYIRSWLFDDARKEGDTTVIENTASSTFYVVGFSKRYRDEEKTADIRAIVTQENNGKEIMVDWNAGEKTEERFMELIDKYSVHDAEGGLFEDQDPKTYDGEVKEWLFSADRKEGDVESFFVDNMYTYVIYYLKSSDPVWKLSATNAIMSTTMSDYTDSITEGMEVSGNLNYLKIEAEEAAEAAAAESEEAVETENAEGEEAQTDAQ